MACAPVCLTAVAVLSGMGSPRTSGRLVVHEYGDFRRACPAPPARDHRLRPVLDRPRRAARVVVRHRGAGRPGSRRLGAVHRRGAGLGGPDRAHVRRGGRPAARSGPGGRRPGDRPLDGWRPGSGAGRPRARARPGRRARGPGVDGRAATGTGPTSATRQRLADVERTAADPAAAIARCRQEHPAWPASELEAWAAAKADVDRAFLRTGRAMPRTPWREIASAIRPPTLVVTGDHEVILDAGGSRDVARLGNPALDVRVVAGRRPLRTPRPGRCLPRGRRPVAGSSAAR